MPEYISKPIKLIIRAYSAPVVTLQLEQEHGVELVSVLRRLREVWIPRELECAQDSVRDQDVADAIIAAIYQAYGHLDQIQSASVATGMEWADFEEQEN